MSGAACEPGTRETTRRWARTPRPARRSERLETRCPTCGRPAAAEAVRAVDGEMFVDRLERATLTSHAGCDLWALAAELTRAAVAERRVRVPRVHPMPAMAGEAAW